MKTTISEDQIDGYRRDGFVHFPGFLDPGEVVELRAAILETVESMGRKKVAGSDIEWEESDSYYDGVFTQRLNLWKVNETVRNYMLNARLGKMLCRLAGLSRLRVWHDQALIKDPFANPTAWHLDNPYWSFHSRDAITIWIALEDVDVQNGCLYFVPGSHKLAHFDNSKLGDNVGELFGIYPEMAEIDPVAVPMAAGDCSFHNGLTAHAAGPNMSRTRRIAMTCSYMPDGSSFNGQKNILPEWYVDSLQIGGRLENNDLNPIVCG